MCEERKHQTTGAEPVTGSASTRAELKHRTQGSQEDRHDVSCSQNDWLRVDEIMHFYLSTENREVGAGLFVDPHVSC